MISSPPARRAMLLLLFMSAIAVALPATSQAAEPPAVGYLAGQAAGARHPTGAFGWSVVWGALFGWWGTGGAVIYYATAPVSPDDIALVQIAEEPTRYQLAYLRGYREAARQKAVQRALLGGGLGLVLHYVGLRSASGEESGMAPLLRIAW
ncbi:MAG TPA: hypothetical protein VF234_00795 [Limnochordia bacterium]